MSNNETLFEEVYRYHIGVQTAKDDLWKYYQSRTADQNDRALERFKMAKKTFYAVLDTLTPDEIRAYGQFFKSKTLSSVGK